MDPQRAVGRFHTGVSTSFQGIDLNKESFVQAFPHDTLPDASSYIRLLTRDVQHGRSTEDGWTLHTWRLSEAPSYHAISYTWGTAAYTRPVMINGITYFIRENCADVLEQVYRIPDCTHFWIDALCIDQAHHAEKSCQVQMMADIYERADKVFIGLGLENDCRQAMQMLCDYAFNAHETAALWETLDPRSETFVRMRARVFADWMSGRQLEDLWLQCQKMSREVYFTRVWTIQELLMARSSFILRGEACAPLQAFTDVLRFYSKTVDEQQRMFTPSTSDKYAYTDLDANSFRMSSVNRYFGLSTSLNGACELLFRKSDEWSLARRRSVRASLTLKEAIQISQKRSCRSADDRIYGLLALIDWGEAEPMEVDYSRSTFALAQLLLERYKLDLRNALRLIDCLELRSTDSRNMSCASDDGIKGAQLLLPCILDDWINWTVEPSGSQHQLRLRKISTANVPGTLGDTALERCQLGTEVLFNSAELVSCLARLRLPQVLERTLVFGHAQSGRAPRRELHFSAPDRHRVLSPWSD